MRRLLAICASVLLCAGSPAMSLELSGRAVVVDGDTLALGAETLRLFGIDAPEAGQICTDGAGRDYDCGAAATRALEAMVAGGRIDCSGDGRDRYGRLIAICRRDGRDLNREMVAAGWARAFLRYSGAYAAEESGAASARRGLWAGGFEAPWDFRQAARPRVSTMNEAGAASGQCSIKGNISQNGRIYHLPGSPDYAATRINPSRGERWFCSEAEARAAGWRPARN